MRRCLRQHDDAVVVVHGGTSFAPLPPAATVIAKGTPSQCGPCQSGGYRRIPWLGFSLPGPTKDAVQQFASRVMRGGARIPSSPMTPATFPILGKSCESARLHPNTPQRKNNPCEPATCYRHSGRAKRVADGRAVPNSRVARGQHLDV